eukprot:scpid102633/ scgid25752/ 
MLKDLNKRFQLSPFVPDSMEVRVAIIDLRFHHLTLLARPEYCLATEVTEDYLFYSGTATVQPTAGIVDAEAAKKKPTALEFMCSQKLDLASKGHVQKTTQPRTVAEELEAFLKEIEVN